MSPLLALYYGPCNNNPCIRERDKAAGAEQRHDKSGDVQRFCCYSGNYTCLSDEPCLGILLNLKLNTKQFIIIITLYLEMNKFV